MKNLFRKSISVVLVLAMVFGITATAGAKETQWISQSYSDIPIIHISGDGEKLRHGALGER